MPLLTCWTIKLRYYYKFYKKNPYKYLLSLMSVPFRIDMYRRMIQGYAALCAINFTLKFTKYRVTSPPIIQRRIPLFTYKIRYLIRNPTLYTNNPVKVKIQKVSFRSLVYKVENLSYSPKACLHRLFNSQDITKDKKLLHRPLRCKYNILKFILNYVF